MPRRIRRTVVRDEEVELPDGPQPAVGFAGGGAMTVASRQKKSRKGRVNVPAIKWFDRLPKKVITAELGEQLAGRYLDYDPDGGDLGHLTKLFRERRKKVLGL